MPRCKFPPSLKRKLDSLRRIRYVGGAAGVPSAELARGAGVQGERLSPFGALPCGHGVDTNLDRLQLGAGFSTAVAALCPE